MSRRGAAKNSADFGMADMVATLANLDIQVSFNLSLGIGE
jgi:hypothetical protein